MLLATRNFATTVAARFARSNNYAAAQKNITASARFARSNNYAAASSNNYAAASSNNYAAARFARSYISARFARTYSCCSLRSQQYMNASFCSLPSQLQLLFASLAAITMLLRSNKLVLVLASLTSTIAGSRQCAAI